jgi:hypothetical protein
MSKIDSSNTHIFENSSSIIPHPQKVEKGGEDAHFLSTLAMGVADGKQIVLIYDLLVLYQLGLY